MFVSADVGVWVSLWVTVETLASDRNPITFFLWFGSIKMYDRIVIAEIGLPQRALYHWGLPKIKARFSCIPICGLQLIFRFCCQEQLPSQKDCGEAELSHSYVSTNLHRNQCSVSRNSVKGFWIEDWCKREDFSLRACYHVPSVFLQPCLWAFKALSSPALGSPHILVCLSTLNHSNWLSKGTGRDTPALAFIGFIPLTELILGSQGSERTLEETENKHLEMMFSSDVVALC